MMLNLANQMAERELEVYLIVCRSGKGELSHEADSRIHIIDLGVAGNTFFALPGFIRQLRKIQPEAVLSALPNINLVAIWAVRLSGVHTHLVVSERNHLSTQIANTRQISAILRPWLYRAFYPWADDIVAVSKAVAEDLAITAHIPLGKIRVIYNPVVTPELKIRASETANHPWLTKSTLPVILTVGRLHPQKDHLTLLMAFKQIIGRMSARLIILGEGPLRRVLEEKIAELDLKEHVDMPGKVTNPYAYMAKADVFVLSSAWEGFPNVLVEAMACGTQVVATDCPGGSAEIVENGIYGSLVPPGNSDYLAEAILGKLETRIKSEDLKKQADKFSAKNAFVQYCITLGI